MDGPTELGKFDSKMLYRVTMLSNSWCVYCISKPNMIAPFGTRKGAMESCERLNNNDFSWPEMFVDSTTWRSCLLNSAKRMMSA